MDNDLYYPGTVVLETIEGEDPGPPAIDPWYLERGPLKRRVGRTQPCTGAYGATKDRRYSH